MHTFKIGDYVRCVVSKCHTHYEVSIKLIQNAVYKISAVGEHVIGLAESKTPLEATWAEERFEPWQPRPGDRVQDRCGNKATIAKVKSNGCSVKTDQTGLLFFTFKDEFVPILGEAPRIDAEPVATAVGTPSPHDMDAAWIQDRLTAHRRLFPPLDAQGRPLRKPVKIHGGLNPYMASDFLGEQNRK